MLKLLCPLLFLAASCGVENPPVKPPPSSHVAADEHEPVVLEDTLRDPAIEDFEIATSASAQPTGVLAAFGAPTACPAAPHRLAHMAEDNSAYATATIKLSGANCAISSGPWGAASTWLKGPPVAGQTVWVPPGVAVVLDTDTPKLDWVVVDGALSFDRDKAVSVFADTLMVAKGAMLDIGATDNPADAKILIADNGNLPLAADRELVSRGVLLFGKTSIYGEPKDSRLRASGPIAKGSTSFQLSHAPVGWRVGDEIVVVGTKLVPYNPTNLSRRSIGTEDERRKITTVVGSRVTVDRPLQFAHMGPRADLTTWVANLSRSVVFEAENHGALPTHRRAHLLVVGETEIDLQSFSLRGFGRTNKALPSSPTSQFSPLLATSNVKGRYPLHLHMTGFPEIGQARPMIRNAVVDGSPGWGLVQHNAAADFYDNVVFDAFSAGMMAEIGNEIGVWDGNAVIKTTGDYPCISKRSDDIARVDMGRCGEGFWFNRMIEVRDNLAAGIINSHGFENMNRMSPSAIIPIPASRLPHLSVAGDLPAVESDIPPIRNFDNNESMASMCGFQIVKSNPRDKHDLNSVLRNFKAWNFSSCGIDLTYTSSYNILDADIDGGKNGYPGLNGIVLDTNNLKVNIVRPTIANVGTGINGNNRLTFTVPESLDFFVVNMQCVNCGRRTFGSAVREFSGTFAEGPPRVSLKGAFTAPGKSGGINVGATVTDALGARTALLPTWDPSDRRFAFFDRRLRIDGSCLTAQGKRAYKLKQVWSDRLSDAFIETDRIVALPPTIYDAAVVAGPDNGPC